MQLAVNTIVVLILGIIIVGGGIALFNKIFQEAVVLPDKMGQQMQEQLKAILLNSNQKIAVLGDLKTVQRKQTATFPAAFQNELEAPQADFRIKDPELVVDPTGGACQVATPPDSCPEPRVLPGPYTVKRYDNWPFFVGVAIPKNAARGQYVYQVTIEGDDGSGYVDYARTKVNVVVN